MAGLSLGWEEVGSKRTKLVVFTVNDPEDTIGEFKSSFQSHLNTGEELEFLLGLLWGCSTHCYCCVPHCWHAELNLHPTVPLGPLLGPFGF